MGDDYYGCDCDMCLRIRYEARLAACEALVDELDGLAREASRMSLTDAQLSSLVHTARAQTYLEAANRLRAAIRGETNDEQAG